MDMNMKKMCAWCVCMCVCACTRMLRVIQSGEVLKKCHLQNSLLLNIQQIFIKH